MINKILNAMQNNLTTNQQAEKCEEICHEEMIKFKEFCDTLGYDGQAKNTLLLLKDYLSNNSDNS